MDLPWLDESQQMWRTVVRDFAKRELAPGALERRRKMARIPGAIIKSVAGLGLMGYNLPERYGGQSMDAVSIGIAVEELAQVDLAASWLAVVPVNVTQLLLLGSENLQEEWVRSSVKGETILTIGVTEPDAGSDALSLRSRAERNGRHYVLNGEKIPVTAGMISDGSVILARTATEHKTSSISAFFVPHNLPGLTKHIVPALGWHQIAGASISLENVCVPEEYRLGAEGTAIHNALRFFDLTRTLLALQGMGLASSAVQQATEWATQRVTFGQPISKYQGVSFQLAEAATIIEAGRLLCYEALTLYDKGMSYTKQASMAKWFCTEWATQIIHQAMLILGQAGFTDEFELSWLLREAIGLEFGDAPHQIQKLVIARHLMGKGMV